MFSSVNNSITLFFSFVNVTLHFHELGNALMYIAVGPTCSKHFFIPVKELFVYILLVICFLR